MLIRRYYYMKKRFIFLSLFSMMLIGLFSSKQTVLAEDKTYQIGTDVTFAPFEFQNTDNEYVGIDIDLLKEIAADQQFEVNFRPLGFNSSIKGVISNQLDGMIAGMSITEERKKTFDFSDPYFDSGIQMAVRTDNETVSTYDDLKGEVVGAKVGTESATFLAENQEKYGYEIKLYEDATGLYGSLKNNALIAIFDDFPILGYAIAQGEEFKLVGEPEKGNSYGFAVKKGENAELLQKFNEGLANLKASGRYDEIVATYIVQSEPTSEMTQVTRKK